MATLHRQGKRTAQLRSGSDHIFLLRVELCPSRIHTLELKPPGPPNVTLLGNRVTADVMSYDEAIRVGPDPRGLVSLQKGDVWTHTRAQGEHEDGGRDQGDVSTSQRTRSPANHQKSAQRHGTDSTSQISEGAGLADTSVLNLSLQIHEAKKTSVAYVI